MTGFNDQDRRGHSLVSGTGRPPSLHPHVPAAGLLCSQRSSALGEGCLAGEAEKIPLSQFMALLAVSAVLLLFPGQEEAEGRRAQPGMSRA